jgi:hypothetical protein
MPGPLGVLGPTVDPNWAWDTRAWTSQANTGDTIQTGASVPGGTTPGVLVSTFLPTILQTAVTNSSGLTAVVVLTNVGSLITSTIIKDSAGNTNTLAAPVVGTSYFVPPGGSIAFGGGTVGAAVWTWELIN